MVHWYFNDSYNQYVRTCNLTSINGLVTAPSLFRWMRFGAGQQRERADVTDFLHGFGWSPVFLVLLLSNFHIVRSTEGKRSRHTAGSCYLDRNNQIGGLLPI
jgi:hypothetical protein